jgi:vancomycin aglycone glucosyltransferase
MSGDYRSSGRARPSGGFTRGVDNEPDCLAVDEVNQQALFKRVALLVHHGGTGATTAAALAGAPQVVIVIPQLYDQHDWARRVQDLAIGTAHPPGTPTIDSLTAALQRTVERVVATRARSIATAVRGDGAEVAASLCLASVR